MRKFIILVIITIITILMAMTPIYVDASSNPGSYDSNVGHELCPVWKNCYHDGWLE